MTARWSIETRPSRMSPRERLAADVRAGLARTPPSIPPKWFYDEKGSLLFDDITRLPEYYPTRTEERILAGCVEEVARCTGARTLVELGSGYSRKILLLLQALTASGQELLFVPVDVAAAPLEDTAERVVAEHPRVTVQAIVADFEEDLRPLPGAGPRLVVFLGSTIGNLVPAQRSAFLQRLREGLDPGDWLLLGADLVKDPARLVAAYDDAQGVTAAFNKNVIEVLARELDADVSPDDFDHVAVWNAEDACIEMRLRARRDLDVHIGALDVDWHLGAGVDLLTETSAKFLVAGISGELAAAGFAVERTWTDPDGDFSLTLARRS